MHGVAAAAAAVADDDDDGHDVALSCRVVSVECYPYTSGDTDETGKCLLRRRPSSEASVDCPKPPPTTSRLYQATPPYRIAPSVCPQASSIAQCTARRLEL